MPRDHPCATCLLPPLSAPIVDVSGIGGNARADSCAGARKRGGREATASRRLRIDARRSVAPVGRTLGRLRILDSLLDCLPGVLALLQPLLARLLELLRALAALLLKLLSAFGALRRRQRAQGTVFLPFTQTLGAILALADAAFLCLLLNLLAAQGLTGLCRLRRCRGGIRRHRPALL
jgi:hypothetical protein